MNLTLDSFIKETAKNKELTLGNVAMVGLYTKLSSGFAICNMITASKLGIPAISLLADDIVKFADTNGIPIRDVMVRQEVGCMIKHIMGCFGYKIVKRNQLLKTLCKSGVFLTGAVYELKCESKLSIQCMIVSK